MVRFSLGAKTFLLSRASRKDWSPTQPPVLFSVAEGAFTMSKVADQSPRLVSKISMTGPTPPPSICLHVVHTDSCAFTTPRPQHLTQQRDAWTNAAPYACKKTENRLKESGPQPVARNIKYTGARRPKNTTTKHTRARTHTHTDTHARYLGSYSLRNVKLFPKPHESVWEEWRKRTTHSEHRHWTELNNYFESRPLYTRDKS
jgi:hypothetical protein